MYIYVHVLYMQTAECRHMEKARGAMVMRKWEKKGEREEGVGGGGEEGREGKEGVDREVIFSPLLRSDT